jgi:hypothetical protein
MAKLDRKKVSVKKVQHEKTAADLVPDERGAPIIYDWNEDDIKKIKNMSRIGLKVSQIAAIMNCNITTMDRRIAADRKKWEEGNQDENNIYAILEKSRAEGDGSIARTCYEVALEQKHPTMLIWLSKVRLGWRETIDVNAETKHTIVYETQLADGVLRQEQKQLTGESGVTVIDAMIDEVTEEVCQKPESE